MPGGKQSSLASMSGEDAPGQQLTECGDFMDRKIVPRPTDGAAGRSENQTMKPEPGRRRTAHEITHRARRRPAHLPVATVGAVAGLLSRPRCSQELKRKREL